MMYYYFSVAMDLAHDRNRELDRAAARNRLAREAGQLRSTGRPPERGRVRLLLARPVRAFSDATHTIADAACTAATRIEGRPA